MNSDGTITLFKLCHKHLFFVIEISNNLFKYCLDCVIKLIFGFKKKKHKYYLIDYYGSNNGKISESRPASQPMIHLF